MREEILNIIEFLKRNRREEKGMTNWWKRGKDRHDEEMNENELDMK